MAQWDPRRYAANTGHHRRHDEEFLASLPAGWPPRLVDLGCGVGDFTARLAAGAARSEVVGVDASAELLGAARHGAAGPRLRFDHCRAQQLADRYPAGFCGGVVSRAMLHWVPRSEQPAVLAGVRHLLTPGGWFRGEFGGQGQLARLVALLDEESTRLGGPRQPWFFPAPADYEELLTAAGFHLDGGWLRLVRQRRSFPDAEAFTALLTSQILLAYDSGGDLTWQRRFRDAALPRALGELRRDDGSYDLDYVRLDFLAHAG